MHRIDMLRNGTPGDKGRAAGALGDLAVDPKNRNEVAKQGAIGPLVDLLSSGTPSGREEAARVLSNLAWDPDHKKEVAEQGAVEPLVDLLSCGNPKAREYAACALGNLAADPETRREVADGGAIKPLADLLGSDNRKESEHAVCALKNLAQDPEFKKEMAEQGAIKALAGLVSSDKRKESEQALCALTKLAEDPEIKKGMVEQGAMKLLAGSLGCPEDRALPFSFKEIQAMCDNFAEGNVLCAGALGKVFKGTLAGAPIGQGSRHVTIKELNLQSLADETRSSVQNAIFNLTRVLSRVQEHRNLVRFMGWGYKGALEAPEAVFLVQELAPRGSLKDLMEKDPRAANAQVGDLLTWGRRVKLAHGAAKGLSYLHHEVEGSILHLDVKPQSIVVDQEWNARVADFGLSELGDAGAGAEQEGASWQTSMQKGTPGYVDPSFHAQHNNLNRKSDVFSFGVVLMELALGWHVCPRADEGHILVRACECIGARGFSGLAMESNAFPNPGETVEKEHVALFKRFVCLALWCCAAKRDDRPTMAQATTVLASICRNDINPGEEQRKVLDFSGRVRNGMVALVPRAPVQRRHAQGALSWPSRPSTLVNRGPAPAPSNQLT